MCGSLFLHGFVSESFWNAYYMKKTWKIQSWKVYYIRSSQYYQGIEKMKLKNVWHEKNLKKSILKNEIHLLKRCEMQRFSGKYRRWSDLPLWTGKSSTFWRLWQGGLSVPMGQFFLPSIFRMCLLYRKNAQKHKKNFMFSEFILVPIVNKPMSVHVMGQYMYLEQRNELVAKQDKPWARSITATHWETISGYFCSSRENLLVVCNCTFCPIWAKNPSGSERLPESQQFLETFGKVVSVL